MRMFATCLFASVAMASIASSLPAEEKAATVLEHKVKSIKGEEVDLSKYKGKVVLVVNVASYCGNTNQYTKLEELNDKYKDKGLAVLGFPCNQFGNQEPESEEQILKFCQSKYNVSFDMFSKVDVKGANASPLYKDLTTQAKPAGDVSWNFEKFLIGRDGEVIERFSPMVEPEKDEIVGAIEKALAG